MWLLHEVSQLDRVFLHCSLRLAAGMLKLWSPFHSEEVFVYKRSNCAITSTSFEKQHILYLYLCVCVYICIRVCQSLWRPEEVTLYLEGRLTAICELPDMSVRNQIQILHKKSKLS